MDDASEYLRREARSLKNEFQSSFFASSLPDTSDEVELARTEVFWRTGEREAVVACGRGAAFNAVAGAETPLICVDEVLTGRVCCFHEVFWEVIGLEASGPRAAEGKRPPSTALRTGALIVIPCILSGRKDG